MRKKIPPEAFEYYFALGAGRSYRAVAEHFGVSKTAVANAADREGWQKQVERRDEKVRANAEEKSVETREEMCERHLKMLRLIQGKAIEALRQMPVQSAMDAIRALGLTIREERVVRGEPGERTAVTIEDAIRREYERWMTTEGSDEIEDTRSELPEADAAGDNDHQERS